LGPLAHSLAAAEALLALPLGAGALALRPAWRHGLRERLGATPRPEPGAVWVHAASVGEVQAARRLLRALDERGHSVFASATSLPGRALLHASLGRERSSLAPLDHPWCAAAALARVRPRALVLVETELWPAWIAAAEGRGIPVVLVSGRVSDRSLPRYRALRPWVARALRRIARIGARSSLDAERLLALGAPRERVRVTGDLKFEAPSPRPLAGDLARVLGSSPLLVAGSTHPGEERAAASALAACERAGVAAALVVAPRRPGRAPAVEQELREAGRATRRRSRIAPGDPPLAPGEVLVLDGLGELAAVYPRATAAFVGGTLAGVDGHDLLEPAFAGVPVLFGPGTDAAREAARVLEASGAGRRVADAAELARAAADWLGDPAAARASGARGRAALAAHRGSAARSADLVEEALAGAPLVPVA
jgi:3-deoxy-D-manno-octulosonic-acid transferase